LKRIITILIIIAVTVGIDQWTKVWAVENVKHQPSTEYFNNFFKIVYAENTGAFLGRGSDLGPTAALEMPRLATIAFSLVVGGGISNIADRFLNDGHVVDFMNMGIGGLRTGIFNFADVFIMIGIGMLLFAQLFIKEEKAA